MIENIVQEEAPKKVFSNVESLFASVLKCIADKHLRQNEQKESGA